MMLSKKKISLKEIVTLVKYIRPNIYDVETTLPFLKEFLSRPKISQIKIEKLSSCLREDVRQYFWNRNQSITYIPRDVLKRVAQRLVGIAAQKVAVPIDKVLDDIAADRGSNWIVSLPIRYEQLIPVIDSKNERTLSLIQGANGKSYLFIIKSISENEIEYDPYDSFMVSDPRAIEELTYIEEDFADRYAQSNGENAFVINDFTDVFGHSHPRGTSPEPSSNDILIADGNPAFILAYNGLSIEMSYSHGKNHELYTHLTDEGEVKEQLAKLNIVSKSHKYLYSFSELVDVTTTPFSNLFAVQ